MYEIGHDWLSRQGRGENVQVASTDDGEDTTLKINLYIIHFT
jgi:hypothetical protein